MRLVDKEEKALRRATYNPSSKKSKSKHWESFSHLQIPQTYGSNKLYMALHVGKKCVQEGRPLGGLYPQRGRAEVRTE